MSPTFSTKYKDEAPKMIPSTVPVIMARSRARGASPKRMNGLCSDAMRRVYRS